MDESTAPEWATAIDHFMTSLEAAGLARTTRRLRRQQVLQLARFADDVGPGELTRNLLERFLSQDGWKPETRYSMRAGVRAFCSWAHHAGHADRDPSIELPRVRRSAPHARAVPDGSMLAALAVADERVALMIRLAGQHGLRRAEIAQVHRDDVEADLLGHSLIVHGKGGKVRRVPLADDVATAILGADGFVFPGAVDGHVSADWVGKLVKRVLPKGYSVHKLRHRFATTAYAVDHDVFAVQRLLGHASPATTLHYVQLPDDAGRRLVQAVAIG